MIQPRSLDVSPEEFSSKYTVWAIQGRSGRYLAMPDYRFPGRRPIRFFTSKYDASRVLEAVLEVRPELSMHNLVPVDVLLLAALQKVAADKTLPRADSFVVHSSDEVYEFISQLKRKAAR
jgi:hypothetical protein